MKTCNKCETLKEDSEFHKSKKKGLQAFCKACRKTIDHAYWKIRALDPVAMSTKQAYGKSRIKERHEMMFQYFMEHPCVDCGETDPIVLTFDHIRDKHFNVSDGMRQGYSMSTIWAEIAKCEVRCGNCHLRKTAKDFGWYTYKLQQPKE